MQSEMSIIRLYLGTWVQLFASTALLTLLALLWPKQQKPNGAHIVRMSHSLAIEAIEANHVPIEVRILPTVAGFSA